MEPNHVGDDSAPLLRLLNATKIFREYSIEVGADTMAYFLYVCLNPGCRAADAAREVGLSKPTHSRTKAFLSKSPNTKLKWTPYPPVGLIHVSPDPDHGSHHILNLTTEGRLLRQRLLRTLGGPSNGASTSHIW